MPEYTPGPWEYVKTSNGHFVMAGRYCVASTGDRGTAKGEANGKLIAAAPEMYEALKKVLEVYDPDPAVVPIRKILRKAEGKQKTGN